MGFHVIRGTFHVVGYSPDGDSIRFKAADKTNWSLLAGPPAKLNGKDHAQLRLEAIDTLETHYGSQHQPLKFAKAAMDHLLAQLGITGVVFNAAGTTVVSAVIRLDDIREVLPRRACCNPSHRRDECRRHFS